MIAKKYCGGCHLEKNLEDFHNGAYQCKECVKAYKKKYFQKNKKGIQNSVIERRQNDPEFAKSEKMYAAQYRLDHKDESKIYQKQYREENKEELSAYIKKYVDNNKEKVDQIKKRFYQKKMNDLSFRLERNFVSLISQMVKKGVPFKKDDIKYLGYSIFELKEHLEQQFELWMNWDNYGRYNAKMWDDNDPTTWKWNIDHIIPKSLFKYSSVEDDSFQECWSLSNLRPYSAKLNLIDGNRRKK